MEVMFSCIRRQNFMASLFWDRISKLLSGVDYQIWFFQTLNCIGWGGGWGAGGNEMTALAVASNHNHSCHSNVLWSTSVYLISLFQNNIQKSAQ